MDLTEGSETSAKQNLTPGKYPKEHTQYQSYCIQQVPIYGKNEKDYND
jgi:hypothetical protein